MAKKSQKGKKRVTSKKKTAPKTTKKTTKKTTTNRTSASKKTTIKTKKRSLVPAIIAVWVVAILFAVPMIFKSNTIIKDATTKKEYDVEQIGNYVTLIGDSISHQSQKELREALPGVDLEAVGGIRFYEHSKYFGDGGYVRLKRHAMRDVVAYLLGSNGGVTQEWIDEVYNYVGTKRKLIFMTVYRGGRYNDTLKWNELITEFAENHDNVYLMDWFSENVDDVEKYLINDRLHPNQAGREHFAAMVRQTVLKALDLNE